MLLDTETNEILTISELKEIYENNKNTIDCSFNQFFSDCLVMNGGTLDYII